MNIIIAGDLCPSPINFELFRAGDVVNLLGQELYSEWMSADYRVFNLETVLTDHDTPIFKLGSALRVPTYTFNGIKALNPQLLCTANNHIYDHGTSGYLSTIELLNAAGIPYVGSGENLIKSAEPYIINGEKTVGIYACADYEFSIASNNTPGANPFDPVESFDHIQALKQKCDHVIVLYHGAKEYYRYPSPYVQRICRKMTDKGADVVVLQHSHCIGSEEVYSGSLIIYGQGNFIFGKSKDDFSGNSLLVRLKIEDGISVDYIPIIKNERAIRLADADEAKRVLEAFKARSRQILENGFIKNEYNSFCKSYYMHYYENLMRYPKWFKKLNHIFYNRLANYKYNIKYLLFLRNLITCDAHKELFLNIAKTEIEEL